MPGSGEVGRLIPNGWRPGAWFVETKKVRNDSISVLLVSVSLHSVSSLEPQGETRPMLERKTHLPPNIPSPQILPRQLAIPCCGKVWGSILLLSLQSLWTGAARLPYCLIPFGGLSLLLYLAGYISRRTDYAATNRAIVGVGK